MSKSLKLYLSLGELYAKQKGLCAYCKCAMYLPDDRGGRASSDHIATRDHRIPRSKGGDNSSDNLVAACSRCNGLKGSMDETLFRAALKRAAEGYPFPFSQLGALAARRQIEAAAEIDEALEREVYQRWLVAERGPTRAKLYVELCRIRGDDVAPLLLKLAEAA